LATCEKNKKKKSAFTDKQQDAMKRLKEEEKKLKTLEV